MLQSFLYSAVNRMQLHRTLRKNAQRHNARRELGLLFIRKDANCDAKKNVIYVILGLWEAGIKA